MSGFSIGDTVKTPAGTIGRVAAWKGDKAVVIPIDTAVVELDQGELQTAVVSLTVGDRSPLTFDVPRGGHGVVVHSTGPVRDLTTTEATELRDWLTSVLDMQAGS